MFNSLASILLLGQVLNPGGFVSDVFESYMSSHNPFESVVPSGVASTKIWGVKVFDFRRITLFC